jgi:hypothetical protein
MAEEEGSSLSEEEADSGFGFKCPDCGRAFSTNQGLGAHRARSHGYRRNGEDEEAPDAQGMLLDEETIVALLQTVEESYSVALQQFLPELAREIRRRQSDSGALSELNTALVILFLDQENL